MRDVRPGAFGSGPSELITVGSTLYFRVDDGATGVELWRSDGVAAGTALVKDIRPGSVWSAPLEFTDVNGTLYFTANDGTTGVELWRSDGTSAGTVLVKDIQPAGSSAPGDLTNVNGTLYFEAVNQITVTELWRSDGTAAGTVLVKDINPGAPGSYPLELTNVNGTLFFVADDGTHGSELWGVTVHGTASVALASSANPSTVGEDVTFTATVAAALPAVAVAPTGTVTFRDGGTVVGTVSLDATGTATFTTSSLSLGSHQITATYDGDATFAPATSAVLGTVVEQATYYFAEGTVRPGFVEYLTLQNPGSTPGTATLTFQASNDAGAPVPVPPATVALPASSRVTFNVNHWVESQGVPTPLNVSVRVASDQPIVAERPVYFSADPALGTVVNGGHNVIGAPG